MAHRDRRAVSRRRLHRGELRHILRKRRVELQLAPVAQGKNRERRHVLGHRRDAEGRPSRHGPAGLAIGKAERRRMDETALLNDPGRKARYMLLSGKRGAGCIDPGKNRPGKRWLGHPLILSGRAATQRTISLPR
jgi:hypothetical protein